MTLFLKLLLSHFIGDFLFQPNSWVKDKEANKLRSPKLYLHIGIHAVILLLLLSFDFSYWLGIFVILISHGAFDLLKIQLQTPKNNRILFFIDQMLHIVVLLTVVFIYEPYAFQKIQINNSQLLLLVVVLIFVTQVSAIIIKTIISKWNPQTEDQDDDSLAKAGKFIGILERLFVFGFAITNHWEGIGFLIAAKSVFRFGDLKESKDRKLTEYILIGTLLSFGLAIGAALLYTHCYKQI